MADMDGKVALVTGGRTGIGAATAIRFAKAGAKVVIGVHKDGDGEETVQAIKDAGSDGESVAMDVSDAANIEAAVAEIAKRYGRLDALVTNAGIEQPETAPIHDVTREDAVRVVDVNLHGTFLTCRAAAPHITEAGGAICLVSSLWGTLGGAGLSIYSATKGGVHALTRALAVELGPHARVNCVAPGAIRTPMLERVMEGGFPFDPAKNIPLERIGEADEIAEAIYWLCSPAARYVTGQVLGADGGITSKMSVCA